MPLRPFRLMRLLAACAAGSALVACSLFTGANPGDPPPMQTTASASATATATTATAALDAAVADLPAATSPVATLLREPGPETCMPWNQAYAETVLRLHTQMMVTSLSCDDAYQRPALYNDYRRFTAERADLLRQAETTTSARLTRTDEDFDTYRTGMANAEAQLAGDVGVGVYCAARQARFHTMETGDFSEYALALTMRRLSSIGGCEASPNASTDDTP
ncbi:MAG: hypothetical protein KDA49_05720 [Rhodospirillaceae bacterium]|nr:hypothetical protein [Rhodospirillaceae bacterium]MCA8931944.1 hypothetical protein [Rhodospirillaceae bacterium]